MELPIKNKIYNYFDDGKINESRMEEVEIKELIKFQDIDQKTLKQWRKEVKQCYWLYNKETDYFVKGFLKETEEEVFFVRSKNGWFSLGWNGGRLDIDGSLTQSLST